METSGFKEDRIRKITQLYYSKPEIQKIIFEFSKNRETIPRYFEGFGKRPDSFQYPSDVLELAKKGATSFHCSEELWDDPLKLSTGMTEPQLNELRTGWDLLIDIDSKYIDYSKIYADIIVKFLEFHGIKNIGIKFSVSGDTPVLMELDNTYRLVSIREAIDIFKQGKKIKVLSLNKEKKLTFSEVYNYLEHKDKIYEIYHSQSKLPLKSTEYHSVFIWDNGKILEKKVKDIKKGDFLVTFNTTNNPLHSNKKEVENLFSLNKNQFSKNNFNKKVNLTPELMRLIGYFLAEGHVTNIINQTGFTFNKNETEYIEDVKNILSSITKRKVSIRHPNPNSTQILIHSKEWATFFDRYCGKKSEKHIPSFSWELPKNLFLEMLKGYIRGDGYKKGEYTIVVKSVSKQLITEFIWLCRLNGISCSLSTEQGKEHILPQGSKFKGSFVYMIKIPKSELFCEFKRDRNKFSPFPRDRIFPIDGLKEVYNQVKPKKFKSHRIEHATLDKKCANLNRIGKVLNWFSNFASVQPNFNSNKIIENYKLLFHSDIGVVEIKEVLEKENELVYDVSVEETESFFGNYYPVLLHNSGSKGFHIIVPWKAFPKEIYDTSTKDRFPELPRIITKYLTEKTKAQLITEVTRLTTDSKYIKDNEASKQVMPDLILVSPRHLFRMPYSLHEKTAMASVVLDKSEIKNFQIIDADPLKVKLRNFIPDSREGEAKELLTQAMDWFRENNNEEVKEKTSIEFKPIKLDKLSDEMFPPCIKKILSGMQDGKKRSLFVLINFFRSTGMEKEEIEKRISDWNKKNENPLKEGYIKTQLIWSYRNKIIMPPNCKEYYQGLGVCIPDNFCRFKNPLTYTIKKSLRSNNA
ncbi:MAG: LAGLIDADG family homing endonuclease [archaeon]|nr:LAGLIDADG family homing endonuclease [archaeon]